MVKKLAIAAISVLIMTISPKMSFSLPLEQEIEKEIQDIKSKGEPITVKETLPAPIPKEENGAFVFEEARALYRKFCETHKEDAELIPYEGTKNWKELSDEEKQKVFHVFFDNPDFSKIFELLEKSLSMKCQFIDNQNYNPITPDISYYGKLRSTCRLISAKAFLYKERGEFEKSLDTILLCTKLNKVFDNEPLAISELVRIAIGYIWLEELNLTTSEFTGDIPVVRKLLEEIRKERNRQSIYSTLISSRAEELVMFEEIQKEVRKNKTTLYQGYFPMATHKIKNLPLYLEQNKLVYLQIMKKLVSVSKLPYWQAREKLRDIWKEKALLPEEHDFTEFISGPSFTSFQAIAKYQAELGNGEIALALKLYKAKHKTYPDTPASLVPEFLPSLPLDPFSGKDYKYQKEGDGFLLYSVGKDLEDNGGETRKQVSVTEGYDIVWSSKQ